jgi:hypothetical protein
MAIREKLEGTRISAMPNRRNASDRRSNSEKERGSDRRSNSERRSEGDRRKELFSADMSVTALGLVMRQQAEKRVPEEAVLVVEQKFAAKIIGLKFPAAQALIAKMIIATAVATISVVGVISTVTSTPDIGHAEEIATTTDATDTTAADALTDILQGRKIAFSGSDCDCGHLNPDEVALTRLKKGDKITGWRIEAAAQAAAEEAAAQAAAEAAAAQAAAEEAVAQAAAEAATESAAPTDTAASAGTAQAGTRAPGSILNQGSGADAGHALAELKETNPSGEYRFIYTIIDEQGNVIDISRKFTLGRKTGDEV